MLTPAQTSLVQATGQMGHHGGQVSPAQGLPDAIFFFTHGRLARALGGVLKKQLRESGLHPGTLSSYQRKSGRGLPLAAIGQIIGIHLTPSCRSDDNFDLNQ
jgi:hypothetical protein